MPPSCSLVSAKGPVGGDDPAIRVAQRHRSVRRLQRFAALEVAIGAELVVVCAAAVHHRVDFGLRGGAERVGINVAEADVFHDGRWVKVPELGTVHLLAD
jgi:hypothetical protein